MRSQLRIFSEESTLFQNFTIPWIHLQNFTVFIQYRVAQWAKRLEIRKMQLLKVNSSDSKLS